MYDGAIVLDAMDVTSCVPRRDPWTYNSGYFIEALSTYTNITGDISYLPMSVASCRVCCIVARITLSPTFIG